MIATMEPSDCASPPCLLHELAPQVALRRVYEVPRPEDGRRVLVERLWPRGVTKAALQAEWLKDLAPSTELRRWYGHDPARWEEFRRRYRAELAAIPQAVAALRDSARFGLVTLVFAARDPDHCSAAVLRDLLNSPGDPSPSG